MNRHGYIVLEYYVHHAVLMGRLGGGKEEIIRKRGRKTERKEGRTDERGDFGILPKHEHMNKHAPPLPRTLPPSGPTHTSLGLTNDRARERGREEAERERDSPALSPVVFPGGVVRPFVPLSAASATRPSARPFFARS